MTNPFDGVAGHAQALDQLRAQVNLDRLAHAYLFVGESGLGKSTTARLLASALLPEAPLTRHPDYWEDDRIKPLSINEIRLLPDKPPEFHELSLQAFLNLKPAVGSRRVALVVSVGRLRDQDQGVLLKTLEEPHPHRVIVLTTPSLNPFVVLPTVVSRCQRVFFHPVPAPEIEKLLAAGGVEAERPGRAREPALLQIPQQRVHGRRPRRRSLVDHAIDQHSPGGVAAGSGTSAIPHVYRLPAGGDTD